VQTGDRILGLARESVHEQVRELSRGLKA